jgi:arylsulfatase A-like enzyme
MIDISPTILHILGLSPEVTWEGRSLFALNRPDRVFLFAPNQEMVAGYRHGHQKFVYRVARNQAFVYDLANDPAEKHNIADEHSGRGIRGHLAGWLQQQDRRNEKLAR